MPRPGMMWEDDEPIDPKEVADTEVLKGLGYLDEAGIQVEDHPLESHPDWPYVEDPEIAKFQIEDPYAEDKKPLEWKGDDWLYDPSKGDITYVPHHLRKYVPPLTRQKLKEGEEILFSPCYVDDDPRNKWLYKKPTGPFIPTIQRWEWGALPWKPNKPLNVPVKYVRFTHTGGQTDVFPQALGILQEMQKEHRALGLDDIAYNHLIGEDGAIYEGRGWYVDSPRPKEFDHLKGNCYDIAYLGDFSKTDPPWILLHSAMDVISYAVQKRIIDPNFKVIPLRPFKK